MISAFHYRKVHLKGLWCLLASSFLVLCSRVAFVAPLRMEVILSAEICTGCNFLHRAKSVQPGIFQGKLFNSWLECSVSIVDFFFNKFSGSPLYLSSLVIYFACLPCITPPPYLTAVHGAAWVMCALLLSDMCHPGLWNKTSTGFIDQYLLFLSYFPAPLILESLFLCVGCCFTQGQELCWSLMIC